MPVILQLTDKRPGGGGIRHVVEEHAAMLAKRGWDVRRVHLCPSGMAPSPADDVVHVSLASRPGAQNRESAHLSSALRGADLLHLHLGFLTLSPRHLEIMAAAAPTLAFLHDVSPFARLPEARVCGNRKGGESLRRIERLIATLPYRSLRRELWRVLLRQTVGLVAPSAFLKTLAIRSGADESQLYRVPHPMVRSRSDITPLPDAPVLLFCGRLSREKGAIVLMEAFANLRCREAKLIVLGEGPERQRIERMALRDGVAGRVQFLGQIPHAGVTEQVARARIVVHPSLIPEGFGMSGVEAMQLGRPVAGFGLGGTAEWLRDGETGLVAETVDAKGLARAVDRLLSSPDLAVRLGGLARRFVEANFSYDAVGRELDSLSHAALSGDPCLTSC